jgi:anthranilate synthase/aminodeoxychorismate synthase-like glutamine amidotransferase
LILVIDNYDSFVHNLARYFRQLGFDTEVARNDALTAAEVAQMNPSAIVISPGPCTPNEAGCSLDIIRTCHRSTPILGVCLGHQAIVQAFGGQIVPANQPMHGRESEIVHVGSKMFTGIPSPFVAGRYHSLVADKISLPTCLQITARTEDHTIMAVEHETLPIVGFQFHPESILTQQGYILIQNFLRLAGIPLPTTDTEAIEHDVKHYCSTITAIGHDS